MWSNFLLVILLLICVITDVKERKIYNAVLFPFLLVAWIVHTVTGGWLGLVESFIGTAVGLSILLIPYLLGGMGAGDVKLLAVIGGLKGMSFVLMTSLYMALAGGILALFIILFRRGFLKRVVYLLHGLSYGMGLSLLENEEKGKSTLPYGVPIAAGAIFQVIHSGGFSL